jgi:nicotinamide mononucleotide transporter
MTKEGMFKKLWTPGVALVMLFTGLIFKSSVIQMIASIAGVIYIALIASEKRIGYIFGIVNVIFYSIVSYNEKLYGLVLYNLIYSLPVLIYGYFKWKDKSKNKIKTMSWDARLLLSSSIILLIIIYIQIAVSRQALLGTAITDAVSVIIGGIASFLMTKKYIEQWIGFITVNITTLIYWIINSIGNPSNYIMIIMWSVYTLNNIYGIIQWNKSRKING